MYASDFEYDGKLLSDFGFMVCQFDGSGSTDTEKGSEIAFELASARNGMRRYVAGSSYKNTLNTTFQICKDPEYYIGQDMEVTNDEFRILSRWLNRSEFLWFHSFDYCEPEKQKPWFRASFTLSRIKFGEATYGIELEMTTDSPFGYGEEIVNELSFTNASLSNTLMDRSDEIGDTYPSVIITCRAAGDLVLADDITGCSCEILDCHNGEIITMSGDTMIITTSRATHDVANDFNYDFFHFGNTFDAIENTITASIPCDVELRYRPIWKDTL